MASSDSPLARAAAVFSGIVLTSARILTDRIDEGRRTAGTEASTAIKSVLMREAILFATHVADRFALASLNLPGRELFMNALLKTLANAVDRAELIRSYGEAQHRYAGFKFFLENDESPGGTLCWEFAKHIALTVDRRADPALTLLVTVASSQTVAELGKAFAATVPVA